MSKYKLRKPALGIDQLSDETNLRTDADKRVTSVREGTNIDLDIEGNVSRRAGYELKLSGSGYHSLYESTRGWLMLCRKQQLGVYDPGTNVFASLTNMDEAYLTSFTELNGNIYFSNPGPRGMIRGTESIVRTLGVSLPSVVPGFSATSNGGLDAGTYGVSYTLVDDLGEESPLGPVVVVDLPDRGAIQGTMFTTFPNSKYRVYMTSADGTEFYQAAEFAADVTSFLISEHEVGRRAVTQYMSNLPYGYIIRAHKSRLYVATNDFVFYSEAFSPHLTNQANGFLPATGVVTMVQPVEAGIYIGDDTGVRFYAGSDPTSFEVKEVSTEPVVFGTALAVPGEFLPVQLGRSDIAAVWLASSGYHVGLPSGEVVRLHTEQVQLPSYVQGCAAFSIIDGRKQVITPVNSNVLADASVAFDSITS